MSLLHLSTMNESGTSVIGAFVTCLKYLLMCLVVVELYHVEVLKYPIDLVNPATGVSYEKKIESPLLRDNSVWFEPCCLRIILKCPLFVCLHYRAFTPAYGVIVDSLPTVLEE